MFGGKLKGLWESDENVKVLSLCGAPSYMYGWEISTQTHHHPLPTMQSGRSCESQLIDNSYRQEDTHIRNIVLHFGKVSERRLLSKLSLYWITGNSKLDKIIPFALITTHFSQRRPVG